jgi:hypothetical protein
VVLDGTDEAIRSWRERYRDAVRLSERRQLGRVMNVPPEGGEGGGKVLDPPPHAPNSSAIATSLAVALRETLVAML